jgi:hypothetical protein
MGTPAAKQGDRIVGIDTDIVMVPSPGGPVPTPTQMPFSGSLSDALSPDVMIDDEPAATKGSTADNTPAHVPVGGLFQKQPANKATTPTSARTSGSRSAPA